MGCKRGFNNALHVGENGVIYSLLGNCLLWGYSTWGDAPAGRLVHWGMCILMRNDLNLLHFAIWGLSQLLLSLHG